MTITTNMTGRKLANKVHACTVAQTEISEACIIGFAGEVQKVNNNTLLMDTLGCLIDDKAKFIANRVKAMIKEGIDLNPTTDAGKLIVSGYKKAHQFNDVAQFSTMIGRYIKNTGRENQAAKRVSVSAKDRKTMSICLVSVKVPAGDEQKDAAKKASVTKGKQLENLMNDSSISCNEAIVQLCDTFTYEAVLAAVLKYGKDKKVS
jgi:hypothetical protein